MLCMFRRGGSVCGLGSTVRSPVQKNVHPEAQLLDLPGGRFLLLSSVVTRTLEVSNLHAPFLADCCTLS